MKTATQGRTGAGTRRPLPNLPLALFHAPLPGEDLDLFSDRAEDALEYDAILHEFESIHDAEFTSARER